MPSYSPVPHETGSRGRVLGHDADPVGRRLWRCGGPVSPVTQKKRKEEREDGGKPSLPPYDRPTPAVTGSRVTGHRPLLGIYAGVASRRQPFPASYRQSQWSPVPPGVYVERFH